MLDDPVDRAGDFDLLYRAGRIDVGGADLGAGADKSALPDAFCGGEDFVPGAYISGAHYLVWAVLSLVVLYVAGVF